MKQRKNYADDSEDDFEFENDLGAEDDLEAEDAFEADGRPKNRKTEASEDVEEILIDEIEDIGKEDSDGGSNRLDDRGIEDEFSDRFDDRTAEEDPSDDREDEEMEEEYSRIMEKAGIPYQKDREKAETDSENRVQSHGKKLSKLPIIITAAVLLVIAGVIAVGIYIMKYKPNTERVNLYEYIGIAQDEIAVFLDGEQVETEVKVAQDGAYYLTNDFVAAYFTDKFYYDAESGDLLYTNATQIWHIPFGGDSLTVTDADPATEDETRSFSYTLADREDETVWLSLDFLTEVCPEEFAYIAFKDPARLYFVTSDYSLETITWVADTTVTVRAANTIKAAIVSTFEGSDAAEKYWYSDDTDIAGTGWTQVHNLDGRYGYVKTEEIADIDGASVSLTLAEKEEYPNLLSDSDVILAWHGVYGESDNAQVEELTANATSLTTISPTWYKVVSADGEITSMADASYVEYVHSIGLTIWPLISDFTSTADDGWDETAMLNSAAARAKIIDTLISEAVTYGYDGWNIDFEKVPTEAGDGYIEFIRELSIACRFHGLVLSVDDYVPRDHTAHYKRADQGECVDYVIVMGYDEHWAGCDTAGSTASLSFVTEGLDATLAMVPAKKVINGVPFYTRLWQLTKDEDGNEILTSTAYSMQGALDAIENLGLTASWDEETGQYVAAGTVDGIYYSCWLEEEDSMRVRIKAVRERNVAGIAAWALGFEKDDIWEILRKE